MPSGTYAVGADVSPQTITTRPPPRGPVVLPPAPVAPPVAAQTPSGPVADASTMPSFNQPQAPVAPSPAFNSDNTPNYNGADAPPSSFTTSFAPESISNPAVRSLFAPEIQQNLESMRYAGAAGYRNARLGMSEQSFQLRQKAEQDRQNDLLQKQKMQDDEAQKLAIMKDQGVKTYKAPNGTEQPLTENGQPVYQPITEKDADTQYFDKDGKFSDPSGAQFTGTPGAALKVTRDRAGNLTPVDPDRAVKPEPWVDPDTAQPWLVKKNQYNAWQYIDPKDAISDPTMQKPAAQALFGAASAKADNDLSSAQKAVEASTGLIDPDKARINEKLLAAPPRVQLAALAPALKTAQDAVAAGPPKPKPAPWFSLGAASTAPDPDEVSAYKDATTTAAVLGQHLQNLQALQDASQKQKALKDGGPGAFLQQYLSEKKNDTDADQWQSDTLKKAGLNDEQIANYRQLRDAASVSASAADQFGQLQDAIASGKVTQATDLSGGAQPSQAPSGDPPKTADQIVSDSTVPATVGIDEATGTAPSKSLPSITNAGRVAVENFGTGLADVAGGFAHLLGIHSLENRAQESAKLFQSDDTWGTDRSKLGTVANWLTGSARYVPAMATGELSPLFSAAQFGQQAYNEAKAAGKSNLQANFAYAVNGVLGATIGKFLERAPGLKPGTATVLQSLAGGTAAKSIAQELVKGVARTGLEGAGFSEGQQLGLGENPWSLNPAEAAEHSKQDIQTAATMTPFAIMGPAFRGMGIAKAQAKVGLIVDAANKAKAPDDPTVTRADVVKSLYEQEQAKQTASTLANITAKYGQIDSNPALDPAARAAQKDKALAAIPQPLRAAAQAHIDAASEAKQQADVATQTALSSVPPPNARAARLSDSELAGEASGTNPAPHPDDPNPKFGQLSPQEVQTEIARRQSEALAKARVQPVLEQIQADFMAKSKRIQETAKTPDGQAILDGLNRHNAQLPPGMPKADLDTVQLASDISPKTDADANVQPHALGYLPVAHDVEAIHDPADRAYATNALKLLNGREHDATAIPTHDPDVIADQQKQAQKASADAAKQGQALPVPPEPHPDTFDAKTTAEGNSVLTDKGISRLRSLVPGARGMLEKDGMPLTSQHLAEQGGKLEKTDAKPKTAEKSDKKAKSESEPAGAPVARVPHLAGIEDDLLNTRLQNLQKGRERLQKAIDAQSDKTGGVPASLHAMAAAHDRVIAEHEQEVAARKAQREPPKVSKMESEPLQNVKSPSGRYWTATGDRGTEVRIPAEKAVTGSEAANLLRAQLKPGELLHDSDVYAPEPKTEPEPEKTVGEPVSAEQKSEPESGSTAQGSEPDEYDENGRKNVTTKDVRAASDKLGKSLDNLNAARGLKGARGIKIERNSDPNHVVDVRMSDDGKIAVHINEANVAREGEAFRRLRDQGDGHKWLADALDEELKHVADLLTARDKWEEAGKPGSASEFWKKERRENLADIKDVIAKGNKVVARAFVQAFHNYANVGKGISAEDFAKKTGDVSDENVVATAGKLIEHLESSKGSLDVQSVSEFIRQMLQAKNDGTLTEVGYRAVVNKLLDWMRSVYENLQAAAHESPELAKILKPIEQVLDNAKDAGERQHLTPEEIKAQEKDREEAKEALPKPLMAVAKEIAREKGLLPTDKGMTELKEGLDNAGHFLNLVRKNGMSLDQFRQELNARGFNFDTPNDMVQALVHKADMLPEHQTGGLASGTNLRYTPDYDESGSRPAAEDATRAAREGSPESAADLLGRLLGTSEAQFGDYDQRARQTRAYLQLAGRLDKILPADFLSDAKKEEGGSEHEVYTKASEPDRVYKTPLPGEMHDYGAGLRKDYKTTPYSYLSRFGLANRILGDKVKWEGVIKKGNRAVTVISQPKYVGEKPTEEEVSQELTNLGFQSHDVGSGRSGQKDYRVWYRPSDDVVLADAEPKNFVKLHDGTVQAVDVIPARVTGETRMRWKLPPAEGLRAGSNETGRMSPKNLSRYQEMEAAHFKATESHFKELDRLQGVMDKMPKDHYLGHATVRKAMRPARDVISASQKKLYAARSAMQKDFQSKPAPATHIGDQETVKGKIPLYNLTEDIEGHPKGSTVSGDTLKKLGYELPENDEGLKAGANQTETPEFKKWFGESKVVDENGKPKVLYHGTPKPGFTAFDPEKTGATTDSGWFGKGLYFGETPQHADQYAGREGGIYPVFGKMEKPFVWDKNEPLTQQIKYEAQNKALADKSDEDISARYAKALTAELQKRGYDGITIDGNHPEYVFFKPEQIKSATGNGGKFDPKNSSIVEAGHNSIDPDDYNSLLSELQQGMPSQEKMDEMREKAIAEKPGEQTIGEPKRANYAHDREGRRVIDSVTHQREEAKPAEVRHREDVEKTVYKKLEDGKIDEIKKTLVQKAIDPAKYGSFTDEDVIAAKIITPPMMSDAYRTGDENLKREAMSLAWASNVGRGDVARALGAAYDPFKSPRERHLEYLTKVIATPDTLDREHMSNLPERDRNAYLQKVQNERLAKIEKSLAQMGIKPEDIFAGEARVSLKSSKFVQDAIGQATDVKTKLAMRLLTDRAPIDAIRQQTGMSKEEVMAARKQFDAELAKRAAEYIDRGFRANEFERMDGLKAGTSIADRPKLTGAERAAEIEKVLKMIRGDYKDIDSGKYVKRRKILQPYNGPKPSDSPVKPWTTLGQKEFAATSGPKPSDKPTAADRMPYQEQMQYDKQQPFEWSKFDAGNKEQVVRAARLMQAATGNKWEMVHEYWQNSILSGPQTHVAISLGQGANAMHEFIFKRPVEAVINSVLKDPKSAQFGELSHLYRGIMPGLSRGWSQAMRTWRTENDFTKTDMLNGQMEIHGTDFQGAGHIGVIPGKLGRVIRIPCRVIMALDSFNKNLAGMMAVGAEAYRSGKAGGLAGDQLSAHIDREIKQPGSDSWNKAYDIAANQVGFHGEVPEFMKDVMKYRNLRGQMSLVEKMSRMATAMIFPFVKVPYNLTRIGLRKSPLGILNVGGHILNGAYSMAQGKPFVEGYSKAQQISDAAEQFLAWGAAGLLASAVEGDSDDDKKNLLITAPRYYGVNKPGDVSALDRKFGGPTMIRLGGRNGIYINYGKFEPLATVLGAIATGVRGLKDKGGANFLPDLMGGVVGQLKGNSFVQGMSTILDTIDAAAKGNTDGLGSRWAEQFLQGFVPNIFRQPIRNWDEAVRDSKFAGPAYVVTQNPAFVNQATDLYGRAETKTGVAPLRVLFQSGVTPSPQLELGDKFLTNYNQVAEKPYYPDRPTKAQYAIQVRGKNVPMSADQASAFDKMAGQLFKQKISGWLTPQAADHPTEELKKRFTEDLDEARKQAKMRIQAAQPK